MSGWWVVVDPRTPAERDASADKISALVASWDAGVSNMQWLVNLAHQGKARQHTFNGYPNRFTIKVSEFLPYIVNGPPLPKNYQGRVMIDMDKITALPDDHILTVDVWDIT